LRSPSAWPDAPGVVEPVALPGSPLGVPVGPGRLVYVPAALFLKVLPAAAVATTVALIVTVQLLLGATSVIVRSTKSPAGCQNSCAAEI